MKPLVLFLGAGASKACGYPTVYDFFSRVQTPQGSAFQAACEDIVRRLRVAEQIPGVERYPHCDAEKVLGIIDAMAELEELQLSAPISIATPRATANPKGLRDHLRKEIVRVYGAHSTTLSPAGPNASLKHLLKLMDERTSPEDPLRIFTTNYDNRVEICFANSLRGDMPKLLLYTGFTDDRPGRWAPEQFEAQSSLNQRAVFLFKLHGSATWKYQRTPTGREVVETGWGQPSDDDCVVYFGYKSIPELEPFRLLHNHLKEVLLQNVVVLAIGFRFADPYIRETFDFALRANPRLAVLCSLTSDPAAGTPLDELASTYEGRFAILRNSHGEPLPFGPDDDFFGVLTDQLDQLGP